MEMYRSHHCGQIGKELVGQEITLSGWVQKRRDLGGVIFIDLRDRSGLVQVVLNPEYNVEAHERGDRIRSEYVLTLKGKVVERSPETVNPKMATGEVEVHVSEVNILNEAKTPPFMLSLIHI